MMSFRDGQMKEPQEQPTVRSQPQMPYTDVSTKGPPQRNGGKVLASACNLVAAGLGSVAAMPYTQDTKLRVCCMLASVLCTCSLVRSLSEHYKGTSVESEKTVVDGLSRPSHVSVETANSVRRSSNQHRNELVEDGLSGYESEGSQDTAVGEDDFSLLHPDALEEVFTSFGDLGSYTSGTVTDSTSASALLTQRHPHTGHETESHVTI